jgi:hypothetical protein
MTRRIFAIAAAVASLGWGASAEAHSAAPPTMAKGIAPLASIHGRSMQRGSELMVYAADETSSAWDGYGDTTRTVSLCVTSSTGHYRLQVTSRYGGAAHGTVKVPYRITFTDGLGAKQTASTERTATLEFTGSAPLTASCHDGPNASVAITMDEHSLLAGVAGTYADRLQFAVETQ